MKLQKLSEVFHELTIGTELVIVRRDYVGVGTVGYIVNTDSSKYMLLYYSAAFYGAASNGQTFWSPESNQVSRGAWMIDSQGGTGGWLGAHKFNASDSSIYVSLLKEPKPEISEEELNKVLNESPDKQINLSLRRKDGKTVFSYSLAPEIEALYKLQPHEIKESDKWKGLSFYSIPEMIKDSNYKNALHDYGLFDNFGDGLIVDGRFNIAWLRTVGGKGEIEIREMVAWAQLSTMQRNVKSFIHHYFDNFVADGEIVSKIVIIS